MVWPFKPRIPIEPCPQIGQYRIDTLIDAMLGLTPVSQQELLALNPAPTFEGEEIWRAHDADFMGLQWEIMLGTVHRSIYKISALWAGQRAEIEKPYIDLLIYCSERYRMEKNRASDLTLFDASDGNIIVHEQNLTVEFFLTVTVTSRKVRQFKRL